MKLCSLIICYFLISANYTASESATQQQSPQLPKPLLNLQDGQLLAHKINMAIFNHNHGTKEEMEEKGFTVDEIKNWQRENSADTVAVMLTYDKNNKPTISIADNVKKINGKKLQKNVYRMKMEFGINPQTQRNIIMDVIKESPFASVKNKNIYFVETKERRESISDMRAPHAEMVLLKFYAEHLYETDSIHSIAASKLPCYHCRDVLQDVKKEIEQLKFLEFENWDDNSEILMRGTAKDGITNWLDPQDIGPVQYTDLKRKNAVAVLISNEETKNDENIKPGSLPRRCLIPRKRRTNSVRNGQPYKRPRRCKNPGSRGAGKTIINGMRLSFVKVKKYERYVLASERRRQMEIRKRMRSRVE